MFLPLSGALQLISTAFGTSQRVSLALFFVKFIWVSFWHCCKWNYFSLLYLQLASCSRVQIQVFVCWLSNLAKTEISSNSSVVTSFGCFIRRSRICRQTVSCLSLPVYFAFLGCLFVPAHLRFHLRVSRSPENSLWVSCGACAWDWLSQISMISVSFLKNTSAG